MTPTKMRTAGLLSRVGVLLVGALTAPVRVQAQPIPPQVVADAKILILGFSEHDKLDPERRQEVADGIINDRLGIALQPILGDPALSCLKASCLVDLAKQWNEADYIVGGAIFEIPQDKTHYEIQAWLYRVNVTEEELEQKVQRQFSRRERCPAAEYPACLKNAVETLVRARPAQERIRTRPDAGLEGSAAGVRAKPSCSRWNFARAATLGAAVGVFGSGVIAGAYVAAYEGFERDEQFVPFKAKPYSAIGFGAAGLALIPAGLALARPSLFFSGSSAGNGDGCVVTPQTRWTSVRGAAVGLFSGLLISGLIAAIAVSANQDQVCATDVLSDSRDSGPCKFSQNAGIAWGLSGAWALGLTLSLAIPSRSGSP